MLGWCEARIIEKEQFLHTNPIEIVPSVAIRFFYLDKRDYRKDID